MSRIELVDREEDRSTATAPSLDHLQSAWHSLNLRYFGGGLPPIPIEWSRRLTSSAGMFVSRTGPRSGNDDAMQGASRRVIRLSLPLLTGQAESEIIGTLAHEMIHQWQFDRLKRRPNHGRDFLRIMAAMNRDGLGITVRHSLDAAVRRHTRYRWQCLACGRDYYRQRHTIRPEEHRCSGCHGRLKEVTLDSMPGPTVRDPVPAAAPVSIIQLSLFP